MPFPNIDPIAFSIGPVDIRWYGLGGSPDGSSADEKRDDTLKALITDELSDRDVIVFEEIVDVARMQNAILPKGFNCTSYEHTDRTHQHVVVCLRSELEFVRSTGDNNFTLEDIVLGRSRSRPAVYGTVKKRNGGALAQIFGVHLKAYPQEADTRRKQVEILATRMAEIASPGVPQIVTGDFNSYSAEKTGKRDDDTDAFAKTFKEKGVPMDLLTTPTPYTYRTPSSAQRLDHFFVGDGTRTVASEIFYACNPEQGPADGKYREIHRYNRAISDHCPLKISLELP